ncbi:MAG: sialate O-acetylesterase [Lachnospiraceae bacterium]|nr:sialate O-acetylesterase [Lachnospiraceae bacterium]
MKEQLKLPKLLGDACILQRGAQTRIWGRGIPGEKVEAVLRLQESGTMAAYSCASAAGRTTEDTVTYTCRTRVETDGTFTAYFENLEAGGPFFLEITSGKERIVSRDVCVGDVFVCSGQSNMELPMRRVREMFPEEFGESKPDAARYATGEDASDAARCPTEQKTNTDEPRNQMETAAGGSLIHIYKVQEEYDFREEAKDHKDAKWDICTPEHLEEVSAFSWFLAKTLAEKKQVPIGILNLSLGGTPIQAWMSDQGLKDHPEYLEERKMLEDADWCRRLTEENAADEMAWQKALREAEKKTDTETIIKTETERACGTISLPGYLQDLGLDGFCGSILLRKKFRLPKISATGSESGADANDTSGGSFWANCNAVLRLGTLTDADQTFVNGVLVGETGYRYPPRIYQIPKGILEEGENEIRIHLVCRNGEGRVTPGKKMELAWKEEQNDTRNDTQNGIRNDIQNDSSGSICLAGEWEYCVLARTEKAPEQVFLNRGPTGLFHGMVAPCLPYTVKGVVWYQGESNDCRPENYESLLKDMIADWRERWMQEKLPFVVVQLPNCGVDIAGLNCGTEPWAVIREAQRKARTIPDVAVTVNIDIGEDNDLHPQNKKAAAKRAALALQKIAYGDDVVCEGPVLTDARIMNEESLHGSHRMLFSQEEKSEEALSEDAFPGNIPVKWKICLAFDREVILRDCTYGKEQDEHSETLYPAAAPIGLFEIAETDDCWYPASAAVQGKYVTLTPADMRGGEPAGSLSRPRRVRYAFRSAPGRILLCGPEGLCVSPFYVEIDNE